MAREEGKWRTMMPAHVPCRHSSRSAPATNGIEVFVSVSRLRIAAIALVKKHCIPFGSARLQIKSWIGAHFTGNEVLRELWCHSAAGWPDSISGSSLTLTGLRAAEWWSWVELELEPRGLSGLWLEQQGRSSREEAVSAPAS